MTMECSCTPFVRGFVPGILIGLFSTVLFFNTLWREPNLRTQRQISDWFTTPRLSLVQAQLSDLDYLGAGDDSTVQRPGILSHQAVRRESEGDTHQCDPSTYLKPQSVGSTRYLLVVLIHSTPRAAELRDAIRASWLSKQRTQQRYLARFVIGGKGLRPKDSHELACENKQYGDLVLLPEVTDTLKTLEWSSSSKLLSSFRWTMDNVKFSYILKCTDSTFAVMDTIVKELEVREHKNETGDYLWGFFAGGMQAVKEGRLSERYWFLCSHYLPFPQGGGYVISHSLVTLLLSLEKDLQHYTHDDIALGVWISPFSGIDKRHDVRFNSGYYSRGCKNVYIVTHKETASTMMQKFMTMMQSGNICKQEVTSRLSYVYNWTAPANRCCVRTPNIP